MAKKGEKLDRPAEVIDKRRRTALEQISIETQDVGSLTREQVTMAAVAARAFNGLPINDTGPPPAAVDVQLLEALAVIHCTQAEMAALLNVDIAVLATGVNREIIERANAKGKQALRRAQWKSALDGNVTAQIWLGKNELGQTDVISTEINPSGRALTFDNSREDFMGKVNQIVERRMLGLKPGDSEQIVGDDNDVSDSAER